MPVAKSIAANSIYNFALKFFRIIVPVVVGSYVVHTIDQGLYGIFQDASTWLDFALIFGVFGSYTYGIREAARVRDDKEKTRKLFSSLFSINLVTNGVVLVIYSAIILLSMESLSRSIYLILGLKVFANVFMVEWLNEAFENYRFITIKTIAVRIIYAVLIFAFIRKPEDILHYCLIIIATDVLNNLVSFIYINKRIPLSFHNLEIKKHIFPLISMLIISNVNMLYTQLDKMMLGRLVGTDAVPIYRIPQDITYLVSGLLSSIVMVAVPRLAYYSEDHPHEYLTLLNRSYHSFMLVVFPACIGFACLAKEVIQIYSGDGYDAAIPVLIIFSFRTIESSVYTVCANQVLYVKNQEKFLVKMLLICGLLNAVLNAATVAAGVFSPVTAILTTFISEIVLMVILFWYIQKRLNIPFRFFTATNMKYLLLSATFLPITLGVHQLGFGNIVNAVIIIPICMAVYFGALLLLKDEAMLFLTNKVLDTVFGRFKKS